MPPSPALAGSRQTRASRIPAPLAFTLLLAGSCSQSLRWDECHTDDDCAHLAGDGGALYCTSDSLCVGTFPDERLCPEVVSPPGPGPRLVLASIVDRHDPLDRGMENAFRLAVDEINAQQPGGNQPFLELHLCDAGPGTDGQVALRAVKWAFEHYQIAAALGPTATEDVISINSYVGANGILVVSPSATSTELSSLQVKDKDFVWRTAPSDALQAAMLAKLVQQDMPPPTPVDVLFVMNLDGTGLENAFVLDYAQGGTGMLKNEQPFHEGAADLGMAIAAVAADHPAAAVCIADTDAPAVVAAIAAEPALANTHIFMTDSAKLTAIFGTPEKPVPPSVLKNIRGTGPATPSSATFQRFATSYMNRYGVNPKDSAFSSNAYDAAYAVALAAAVTTDHVPSGADLVTGMMKFLHTGTALSVGPMNYLQAVSLIAAGKGVRMEGASGPLEFDAHGDPSSGAYEVWGIDVSGPTPKFITLQ